MAVERKIVRVHNFFSTDLNGNRQDAYIIEYQEGTEQRAVGFPLALLSWRAAEYGIDPNDVDMLLTIGMHEHLFPLRHDDPTFLYNTDEKTARAAHLKRISDAKEQVTFLDPDNLLQQIKDNHLASFNMAEHRGRQAHVAELRERRIRALSSGGPL